MKIQVLKKRKQWYWKIIAANGETLATSETYNSKQMAMKTACLFLEPCPIVSVEVWQEVKGKK